MRACVCVHTWMMELERGERERERCDITVTLLMHIPTALRTLILIAVQHGVGEAHKVCHRRQHPSTCILVGAVDVGCVDQQALCVSCIKSESVIESH